MAIKSLDEILRQAKENLQPPTWGALSKEIDAKTGKTRTYVYAPLGEQARIRSWRRSGIPQRYIQIVSELSGVPEMEVLEANYTVVVAAK